MDKLKRCDYCKSDNVNVGGANGFGVFIECRDCKARGPIKNTWQQAAEAWNSRPGEGVSVKPLVWEETTNVFGEPLHLAEPVGFCISVVERRGQWQWDVEAGYEFQGETHDAISLEEGKLAAEAEYRRLIQQHLTPSEPVNGELVRALQRVHSMRGLSLKDQQVETAWEMAEQALARANSQDGLTHLVTWYRCSEEMPPEGSYVVTANDDTDMEWEVLWKEGAWWEWEQRGCGPSRTQWQFTYWRHLVKTPSELLHHPARKEGN